MEIEKIIETYKMQKPFYEKLSKEVKYVLEHEIENHEIKISNSTCRVKTSESLTEKIKRKFYKNPLRKITDIAGVRIVCYYESDIHYIIEIIKRSFTVHEDIDNTKNLGVDKMGYHGSHFVISLGSRYSGARYDRILNLKCEIQVRTVLQDAWALISHHLVYKEESSIPTRVKRDLNNVASLLEIAQGIFDFAREKKESYILEIHEKEKTPSDFLSQPVDYETLYAYTKWKYKDLPVSDKWHDRLLSDLNLQKYPSLKKIDDIVERTKNAVMAYQKENSDWFKSGTAYITKSLGFVDEEFRKKHSFGQKTRDAFPKYAHLIKA
jgi:ppGpp synthetase/RelA/SpoT-type nucleotidyltranferase